MSLGSPPRNARLGATLVDIVPALVPIFPCVTTLYGGHMTGMGGFVVLLYFGAWSLLAAAVSLVWGLGLLARRRTTLGLARFHLVFEGGSAASLVLATLGVVLMPPVVGFVAYYQDGIKELFWWVTGSLYAFNWLVWLLPGQRTLRDILAGSRVVRVPASDERIAAVNRWWAPDVTTLLLPVLALAVFWRDRSSLLGGLLAVAAVALLVGLRRRRSAIAFDGQSR